MCRSNRRSLPANTCSFWGVWIRRKELKHVSGEIRFVLLDDTAKDVMPVSYAAEEPLQLEQSEKIVVIGTFDKKASVFRADKILTKCSFPNTRKRKRNRDLHPVFISRPTGVVMKEYLIAPSILSADFARLGEDVRNVLSAGADIVHFDVMDNHYVPNLTMGPLVCAALRKYGISAPIDVHLMVRPVDRLVPDFADAGATYITFHPEGSDHVDRTLQLIKKCGCKAGLVFNPATSLDVLAYELDRIDMILLMSVNPGFGGQSFIESALPKLREARAIIDASGRDIRLEIDGGVNTGNIRAIAEAGADTFVSGSAIFASGDYRTTINAMRTELAKAAV